MSKTSAKGRYTQLMSWLSTYKSSPKFKNRDSKTKDKPSYKRGSKLDYYKRKGA
tara:strand:- start:3621 stop:3782 length:162 start_codon:yes stop_codon:yes gene_type:complete